ncbi:peptidase [Dentipellis sp. KUC8613]|nr:peptidase [Dentipellis sp. KUC8613]
MINSFAVLVSLACAVTAIPASSNPLFVQHGDSLSDQSVVADGFDVDLGALRLVEMQGQPPVWMTELDKINAKAQGIKFFDITETQDLESADAMHFKSNAFPSPNATEQVKGAIRNLSTDGPKANLEKFTSFRTRYYRSDTGRQSQKWLSSKISEITTSYASKGLRDLISLNEFTHSWGQNSIILRINGSAPTNDGVIIISAHQDSTNMWPFLPAPGADDDGSGTVTILEAYRGLLVSDFRPVQHVEFHWYSGEEAGLLGSQAVASDYSARSVNVIAMSQFDMTAWVKRGTQEEVGIVTDFVDENLSNFNKQLVDAYLDIPYVETKCGYACSDHASWGKAGYPSSFTIESTFENSNKNIHSINDRIDISDEFSFTHMLEFSKLAVAFAIELGGWKGSD